jgi:hypothetical protein
MGQLCQRANGRRAYTVQHGAGRREEDGDRRSEHEAIEGDCGGGAGSGSMRNGW